MNRWPSRAGRKAPINRTRSKRFAPAKSVDDASAFGVRACSAPLSQGSDSVSRLGYPRPMVARTAAWLVGLAAFVLPLALAEIRAEVPEPEPSPTLASGPASAPAEEETKPYKKLSLEELMNIEVSTVSRTESTVWQSPAADHHPESGTSTAVRSPIVEIRRGV
jgi:hypothetical protein